MGITISFWARMGLVLAVAAMAGCVGSPDATDGDQADSIDPSDSAIVGGTAANVFPESVLIYGAVDETGGDACSGVLIAPRVVLTAGHCIPGPHSWTIDAPFAGNQEVTTTSAAIYDYQGNTPTTHDIGLIFLPSAIKLSKYPTLAATPIADGTKIVNIGRVQNGQLSWNQLFVSKAASARSAVNDGYVTSYAVDSAIVQPGDSGGPDMVAGTHKIVAVNSAVGNNFEVLARVDLLKSWITAQVAAHGGFAKGGGFK